MPILDATYRILYQRTSPSVVMRSLAEKLE